MKIGKLFSFFKKEDQDAKQTELEVKEIKSDRLIQDFSVEENVLTTVYGPPAIKPELRHRQNPLFQKKLSVYGDSISTLEAYTPYPGNDFYQGVNKSITGVRVPADTWWGTVAEKYEMPVTVINAYSGARVSKMPEATEDFPSGISSKRIELLHWEDDYPDIIFVFMGLNDFGYGVSKEEFRSSYRTMLQKISGKYPKASVMCLTLVLGQKSNDDDMRFPERMYGTGIWEYNEIIREEAAAAGVDVIDIAACGERYEAVDGTHPDAFGMKQIARMVIRQIEISFCGKLYYSEDFKGIPEIGDDLPRDKKFREELEKMTVCRCERCGAVNPMGNRGGPCWRCSRILD